jgi:hypothetical protein
MGPRPSPDSLLARHDKSGDFTPNNCFWGTRRNRNSKRFREITYNGKTQCLAAWAEELGISREAMRYRVNECLRRGLDISLALTAPVRQGLAHGTAGEKKPARTRLPIAADHLAAKRK